MIGSRKVNDIKKPKVIHELKQSQQLNCSPEVAWEFFSSPYNLERITPAGMNFRILNNPPRDRIYEGLLIEYKVTPLPLFTVRWQTRIMEVNQGEHFTDLQVKGPYKLWKHRHMFTPARDGVLMTDHLQYELPLGFLGEMAHTLLVKRRVRHIFKHRRKVLESLFNTKTGTD